MIVIASGTSPEFAAERYGPNAIQFVEKPFELADFGAAVQALLGPWTEASSGDSRGTLRDLNLRDLVPLAVRRWRDGRFANRSGRRTNR